VESGLLTYRQSTADRSSWRIFDRDWSHYDYHRVFFRPRGMSAKKLQAGHDWITHRFYRPWRIARRLARLALRPRGWRAPRYAAAINLAYYGRTARWSSRQLWYASELRPAQSKDFS
jgi:hypothetical protein